IRLEFLSVQQFGQFRGKRNICFSDVNPMFKKVRNVQFFILCLGRCIKKRLVCNVDNDCGDFSDESNCERDPKSPCRDPDIEVSEIGRTAGQGILGMQPMASPFENEYFNGLCDRVRDGNTRTYYRKPWNVAFLNYDVKYPILKLRVLHCLLSKTCLIVPFVQKQTFMHVKGKIQLGRFQMRSRDVRLTDAFLEDLKFLPTEYDKGEYFRFLEMYGTHYAVSGTVGGKYELLYVLDNYAMSLKGMHIIAPPIAHRSTNRPQSCNEICEDRTSCRVIDDIISLVEGGKIDFSVKIKEMLLRNAKVVDVEDYIQWATSLIDAPVVIQQKVRRVSSRLIKMKDAHIKKQNLERAIEDYITEYSVCKCEPCKNGVAPVPLHPRQQVAGLILVWPNTDKKVTDGGWSCWTAWSHCVQGEHTRTRQCNNPTPGPGGRPCQGDSIEKSYCSQAK
uniref:Complement C9 n=1 Tax=Chelonoidis abingdonii TaxID=106734 RepID=A0A8C0GHL3_CHEAB